MLQHRGQDAAGMVVCDNEGRLHSRKSMGYVRDVFHQSHMNKLVGHYGIGHVRYPTAGGAGKEFAQPMYVNSPYGISLAHNGNLTNSKVLARELFHAEMRHLNTDSDSTEQYIHYHSTKAKWVISNKYWSENSQVVNFNAEDQGYSCPSDMRNGISTF